MNLQTSIVDELKNPEAEQALEKDRYALLEKFVETNPEYYNQEFQKIGSSSSFSWTFNWIAALLGPIWFGMRHLWHWGLPFLIVEAIALIQMSRGFFGDLSADARERISQVERTLEIRKEQLESAIANNADNVDVFRRTVESLESAIGDIRLEAQAAEASGIWVALTGVILIIAIKFVQGSVANTLLEKRFSDWLSDRSMTAGLSTRVTSLSALFVGLIFAAAIANYAFPGQWPALSVFPTDQSYRITAIDWVTAFFDFIIIQGEWVFDLITGGIRAILDSLEILFVTTPWVIIAGFIIVLTGITAGTKASIFAAGFLAYMGFLGFWEKAMTTLALLGTAACISIALGIPLGMFCARRPRVYAVIRPIMDFMQTMPSFVFMIPVIAFFGTGKPAAVVTCMIFGGTPVVRLTVLGLRGVPEHIREAAIAYGASKWYLLTKVDLPLAAPSILAGVNQTIMLSLAMVVVASLIGARGLGEDVLEALQYSSVGQGILAGFAILFCAMILNSIVQGKRAQS